MHFRRYGSLALLIIGGLGVLAACSSMRGGPSGNENVPQPAKAVDLDHYLGHWYEFARYENGFERGCEAVTADYAKLADGLISVVNSCAHGSVTGPLTSAQGKAKVVKIDVGNFDKNLGLAQRYGNPIAKGIPAVVVVGHANQVVFATRNVDRAYLYYYNDDDEPAFHGASGLTRNFQPKMSFWAVKQLYEILGAYRFKRIVKQEAGNDAGQCIRCEQDVGASDAVTRQQAVEGKTHNPDQQYQQEAQQNQTRLRIFAELHGSLSIPPLLIQP